MSREAMVNLSVLNLINECSLDNRPKEDIYIDLRLMNRENIHEVFKYKKFNYDFIDKVTCYNDGSEVIGTIRPSYSDFMLNLCRFLNVSNNVSPKNNLEITRELRKRISKLENLKSERELKEEFPLLFNDLLEGRSFIDSVENMERKTPSQQDRYETQRHYYYSCALKRNFKNFIETQASMWKRYVDDKLKYKKQIEDCNLDKFFEENFDQDKLAMYTTSVYLRICENAKDVETIKKYLKLITNYLNSDYDKNVEVRDDYGNTINIKVIDSRVNKIINKLNVDDSVVEWELIPNGKEPRKVKAHSKNKRVYVELLNYEEVERLREKGNRKSEFYEETNYLAKAVGLLQYRGYIAYIYPNGEVLLDTEFNEANVTTAVGDAIYNIKAADFERLSRLDKVKLRRLPEVARIIHSKNWEDRAREVISKETSQEEKDAAVTLVKKLKEKKK